MRSRFLLLRFLGFFVLAIAELEEQNLAMLEKHAVAEVEVLEEGLRRLKETTLQLTQLLQKKLLGTPGFSIQEGTPRHAFVAQLSKMCTDCGHGSTIRFDQIVINVMDKYDPIKGQYTCPQVTAPTQGVFLFMTQVEVNPGTEIDYSLRRRGLVVAYGRLGRHLGKASSTSFAIVRCTLVDVINVARGQAGDSKAEILPFSSFNGLQLY